MWDQLPERRRRSTTRPWQKAGLAPRNTCRPTTLVGAPLHHRAAHRAGPATAARRGRARS
ncbi:MAG: hypothetical protein U5R31_01235 [Acidimicrobiia bacterium]|nr:hypothetical protein [Acidimicrobiia bacterium]